MKAAIRLASVTAVAFVLVAFNASAQVDRPVEVSLGIDHVLVSQKLEIDSDTAFTAKFGIYAQRKFQIGLMYSKMPTQAEQNDTIQTDLTFYGFTATYKLTDETPFDLTADFAFGVGEFETNADFSPGTDISLWYQFGFGAQYNFGQRWFTRLQLDYRVMQPDNNVPLFTSTRSLIVPGVQFGLRF